MLTFISEMFRSFSYSVLPDADIWRHPFVLHGTSSRTVSPTGGRSSLEDRSNI